MLDKIEISKQHKNETRKRFIKNFKIRKTEQSQQRDFAIRLWGNQKLF